MDRKWKSNESSSSKSSYRSLREVSSKSSYRSLKEVESQTEIRSKHESKHETMQDSKTPPLPTRRSSIEELLERREYLKKKLEVINKHSESHSDTKLKSKSSEKSREHSINHILESRKRQSIDQPPNIDKKKKAVSPSAENNGDYAQIESEDEEEIIERRRQQRKQLLEKLKASEECKKEQEIDNDNPTEKQPKPIIITEAKKETTDMFAEKDDYTPKHQLDQVMQDNNESNAQLNDNWDDSEGYYNIKVGDEIDHYRYVIKSILGKGVFANVIRAYDKTECKDVAIKIVRNNDLMYKTGLSELTYLKNIADADPENKYHCVKYLAYFIHRNHLCIVLESLHMDLRSVLKKYGRHHGLSIKALTSYSRQLLVALRLLKKIGIIHGDIKPDNILVNEKKNMLKLCDFGSATTCDDNEPTPYLVSRFYRAPEIILGLPYKHSVDIWSAACTMFELATGRILFTGSSNNRMLKCFMDLKGKFPSKLIRKGKFKDQHFNYNNNFLLHKKDEFSGREKVVEMPNINITRNLNKELRHCSKNFTPGEEKKMCQFRDILDKMLILDINHRYTVSDCLRHPFVQEDIDK